LIIFSDYQSLLGLNKFFWPWWNFP